MKYEYLIKMQPKRLTPGGKQKRIHNAFITI